MYRSNFRIKLDLCKYYNDVRRFCWIFVDGTKILQISHLKEHISKLLNIKQPFHLLLNDNEYLPPNEDTRIIKENETILVSPGSGLENESALSTGDTTDDRMNFMIQQRRGSVQSKQSQTNTLTEQSNATTVTTLQNEITTKSQTESSEFSTVSHGQEDSELSSTVESKATDVTLIEDFNVAESLCPRRKRVRHRKKRARDVEQSPLQEEETKSRKPKIVNSCIVSSNKHIRFDHLDNEEIIGTELNYKTMTNGSNMRIISPPCELANLLSLGKNSSPLTFTSTRTKTKVKVEHMSDEEVEHKTPSENKNESVIVDQKIQNGRALDEDLVKCPIMTTKPQLKDIIAFKMLKIGSDYTPQVSDFIMAEVVSYCPKTSVYTFRILQGLSEVQVPIGKFTIVEDDEPHVMSDTITVNYAQIMEPRLISSSSETTPVQSTN